MMRVTDKMINT